MLGADMDGYIFFLAVNRFSRLSLALFLAMPARVLIFAMY